MSDKMEGNQDFDGPDEKEIDEYLEKSQKSLARMKNGDLPLFFRSEKQKNSTIASRNLIVLAIIFLFILPSIVLISSQFGNMIIVNPEENTNGDTDNTTEPISYDDLDVNELLSDLKHVFYSEMMNDLASTPIKAMFVNGNTNNYRNIENQEYLDMMWLLSLSKDSSLREIGYDACYHDLHPYLVTSENHITVVIVFNSTIETQEDLQEHLRLLRSLLSFDLSYSTNYYSTIEILWNTTRSFYNQEKGFFCITAENSTEQTLKTQLLALNTVKVLWDHRSHFNINRSLLVEQTRGIINTLDGLMRIGAVPGQFYSNLTSKNKIYYLSDQTELYQTLLRLSTSSFLNPEYELQLQILIGDLIDSINFDMFSTKSWTYKEALSSITLKAFGDIKTKDQCKVISRKVEEKQLNTAKYIAETILDDLWVNSTSWFQISNTNTSVHLLDQIAAYNALYEIEVLKQAMMEGGTEYPAASAWFEWWLVPIVLIVLSTLSFKKRKSKSGKYK